MIWKDLRGFPLRKWNSSEPAILEHIDPSLRDVQHTHTIIDSENYIKTLDVEWSSSTDEFSLMVNDLYTQSFSLRKQYHDI